MEEIFDTIADEISRARSVAVFTGAGMSQESGIPTFRDAQTGLWARFRPEDLATLAAFLDDPPRVFAWYLQRLMSIRGVVPNDGHAAIASLDEIVESVDVITQNIDGLHARAGSASVFELHGSIERFRCVASGHAFPLDAVLELADGSDHVEPPACPACGALIRPGVVWFGEMLPEEAVAASWESAAKCDVMLVVGTAAQVFPAAELPSVAAAAGATIIEINPEPTRLSDWVGYRVPATAAMALPRLIDRLAPAGSS